jgi:hypothetical protein
VFTIRRIQRSQSTGMGVHDRPDSVFTIHRIAQHGYEESDYPYKIVPELDWPAD